MRVLTAPSEINIMPNEISIFLAGGIQKTENWQKSIIESLEESFANAPLVVFNPRRDNFPIHDPSAAFEQISWEYNGLNIADMFSMYFAEGETDQPICMYEYGKWLERKRQSGNWDTIVVSAEPKYRRYQDVIIQTGLVNPYLPIGRSLEEHKLRITQMINNKLFDIGFFNE